MTDLELLRFLTTRINAARALRGEPPITEQQVQQGLALMEQLTETEVTP